MPSLSSPSMQSEEALSCTRQQRSFWPPRKDLIHANRDAHSYTSYYNCNTLLQISQVKFLLPRLPSFRRTVRGTLSGYSYPSWIPPYRVRGRLIKHRMTEEVQGRLIESGVTHGHVHLRLFVDQSPDCSSLNNIDDEDQSGAPDPI